MAPPLAALLPCILTLLSETLLPVTLIPPPLVADLPNSIFRLLISTSALLVIVKISYLSWPVTWFPLPVIFTLEVMKGKLAVRRMVCPPMSIVSLPSSPLLGSVPSSQSPMFDCPVNPLADLMACASVQVASTLMVVSAKAGPAGSKNKTSATAAARTRVGSRNSVNMAASQALSTADMPGWGGRRASACVR